MSNEKPDSCPTCNRFTPQGLHQLAIQSRSRPIYGTDFSKPLSVLIEDVRNQLAQARGQLSDIGSGFSGWRDRVDNVEGLLTCGLIALHSVKMEMEDHERRYPKDTHLTTAALMATDGGTDAG